MSTANVLRMNFFDTLLLTPGGNFEITNDYGISTLSNRNHIAYMVAMSMADENKICSDSVRGDRSSRVFAKEGISNEFISIGFEQGCSVSVPG